jgi:hypothetical protein
MQNPSTIFAAIVAAILSLLAVAFGTTIGLMASWSDARAHSWYDKACCDMQDCHRIEPEELTFNSDKWIWTSAKSGAVHVIPTGERSPVDGQFRIRVSKDGQYHGCERNLADKPGEPARWHAYCLYFPEMY